MMYKSITVLALAAAAATAGAQQQADRETTLFLTTAIEDNIAEIQIGTLAEQRASGDVRELADMIVKDHKKALEKSTRIAEDGGIEVPRKPSAKSQNAYDELARQSPNSFERQFIDLMVKDHQSAIDKYQSYVGSAGNGSQEAVDYAKSALPTLRKHLETAKSLENAAHQ